MSGGGDRVETRVAEIHPSVPPALYLQADALGRNLSQVGEEMTMFTPWSTLPACSGD